jgi:hypothetical protein
MFTRTLRPRVLALPKPPALARTYTRAAAPSMPSSAPLRTLLRSSTLRASSTAAQRAYALSTSSRARTPSPPPPYTVRGVSLQAGGNAWTRFRTPLTLSSVRTFSGSARALASAESTGAPAEIAPETAQSIEEAIEEITELFATAKDEFEIAAEETERNTTYAEDDRAAAREELDKLLEFYRGVVEGGDKVVAEEVKRRVGHRIRELEHAVIALEEAAMHHD